MPKDDGVCPALRIRRVEIIDVVFQYDLPAARQAPRLRKKFASYTIKISPMTGQPWIVNHRFGAFAELHRDICNLNSSMSKLVTKGLRIPSKYTIGKTSKRVVAKRAVKLENFLQELLSRLPSGAIAARSSIVGHAPNVVNLLSDFLLCQYHNGVGSNRAMLTRTGSAQSIKSATEALNAQTVGMTSKFQNPLEINARKILELTGQSVTEILDNDLLNIVCNDSRKNGITHQIKTFTSILRKEYEENADPYEAVARTMTMRENEQNGLVKSNKRRFGGRARMISNRFMSVPDSKALDRAIIASKRRRAKRKQKGLNADVEIEDLVSKILESRLARALHFTERVYDIVCNEHLTKLMARLPKLPMSETLDEDLATNNDVESNSVLRVAVKLPKVDSRVELVKKVISNAVERATCVPVYGILFYYATKIGKTSEFDTKIESNIELLKSRFSPGEIPQSVFGIAHESPSGWQLAVDRLSSIKESQMPTQMLVDMLSTVHAIHSLYYYEAMQGSPKNRDPDPLGADDFLPIFVYVIVQADLACPQTTFEIISRLANRDRLEGLFKYFLTVFESALWYLANHDFSDAGVNEDVIREEITKIIELEHRATKLNARIAALRKHIQLNGSGVQRWKRRSVETPLMSLNWLEKPRQEIDDTDESRVSLDTAYLLERRPIGLPNNKCSGESVEQAPGSRRDYSNTIG